MTILTKHAGFAAAAALIAVTSAATSTPVFAKHAAAEKVACYGVNACKGQSDCKSGNHDCKGQNDCKGQGFKDLTKNACAKAGGSLTAPN
ncbi:putative membrane protein [Sphingobium sp. OAS761]|uniref:BufA2 family periplasmic bufferin-type metallophore n=1 Tax=Sphingobium sp. OAS761 TaxID=2817901 RepID=UPI00209E4D5B|nr:hypothetical protein [Sphingobium sp. OAS761]MCP1469036.1 putative membrane protein [Sphingobium sp. OAS761]